MSNSEIDAIEAYKNLPIENKLDILAGICELEELRAKDIRLTPQIVTDVLTKTGYFDIAVKCYSAQLLGHKWR